MRTARRRKSSARRARRCRKSVWPRCTAISTIWRITARFGKDRFDPTLVPHEHAICRVCGKMRDVETGDLRAYLRSHLKTDDFCYELCIHDVCPECRARIQDNKALKEE